MNVMPDEIPFTLNPWKSKDKNTYIAKRINSNTYQVKWIDYTVKYPVDTLLNNLLKHEWVLSNEFIKSSIRDLIAYALIQHFTEVATEADFAFGLGESDDDELVLTLVDLTTSKVYPFAEAREAL